MDWGILYIMDVCWWVLVAIAIVFFVAYIYTQIQYYKWDRDDRRNRDLVAQISQKVGEKIDEKLDLGGGKNDIGF